MEVDHAAPEDKIEAAVVALGAWLISDNMTLLESWNAALDEME